MAQQVLRFIQIAGRFGVPLVFVVTVGLMAYDQYRPWSLANELVPNRSGQTRLLVGAGYSSRSTYSEPGQISERTAEYIYYPEVLSTGTRYVLSRNNDEKPAVYTGSFSLVVYLAGVTVAVALSIASWWFPLDRRT